MADPPAVSKFQLSSVSSVSAPNFQHFSIWMGKNTSFDSILQRLYLQKSKKKIPFPGRRQHGEWEPGKLLLIHAKLHTQHRTVFLSVFHPFHAAPTPHSHIQDTHTPTHPSFKEFVPSCSKQPACSHTPSPSRETPSFHVKIHFGIYFW